MKLMHKILISISAVTIAAGASTGIVLATNRAENMSNYSGPIMKPFTLKNYEENKKLVTSKYPMLTDSGVKTLADGKTKRYYIDEVNDNSDISLFYNGAGAITNVYMMRLAMLTRSQVYYAIPHDGNTEQNRIDMQEFSKFLNNGKKGVSQYGTSKLINVGTDITGNIVDKWKEIIIANPDKKINIWWNSYHVFTHSILHGVNGSVNNKIYDLAGFKNVQIHMLEDGPSNWGLRIGTRTIANDELFKNPKDLYERVNNFDQAGIDWILSTSAFDNVDSFYSDKHVKQAPEKLGAHYLNPIHLNGRIFNERFLDPITHKDVRLMSEWPKISGNDWRKELKVLEAAKKAHPSKHNMILMGNYGISAEEDYIKYIWDKYHSRYNIFYKGHPGHSRHSNWIKNVFNKSHSSEPMFVLEPMISSEELTRDHVNEGMKFDKFVSTAPSSGAISSTAFDNSANDPKKDIIEVYNYRNSNEKFQPSHVLENGAEGWNIILKKLNIN
ncbi:MAG: hypothetical protein KAG14_03530 [Mycoplasmataceae bacterium]|nr:hypothetical protein [Mycoplasmataceae bacterium]